jgi:hypothetical protein
VNKRNEKKIYRLIYGYINTKKPIFKFKIGKQKRISKYKSIFKKGYTAKWIEEICRIKQLIPREPTVYKKEDFNGQELKRVCNEQELRKVFKDENEAFVLDKIYQTKFEKGIKKNVEFFVN